MGPQKHGCTLSRIERGAVPRGGGAGGRQPSPGGQAMSALYWLTGLISAGLFVYLLIALWRAEEF